MELNNTYTTTQIEALTAAGKYATRNEQNGWSADDSIILGAKFARRRGADAGILDQLISEMTQGVWNIATDVHLLLIPRG